LKNTETDDFERKFGTTDADSASRSIRRRFSRNKDNTRDASAFRKPTDLLEVFAARHKEDIKPGGGRLKVIGPIARSASTGPDLASGTYGFVNDHVLRNGEHKDDVKNSRGRHRSCQGVYPSTLRGSGDSGIGYLPRLVFRPLQLSK